MGHTISKECITDNLILYISNVAKMYNEKEMIWEQSEINCEGDGSTLYSKITIEFPKNEAKDFIIRRYYSNGSLFWQEDFKNYRRVKYVRYETNGKIDKIVDG